MPFFRQGLSSRAFLVLLAIALLAPVVLFTGNVLNQLSLSERSRFQERTLETAQRTALALDRDVAAVEVALGTLATSQELESGDLSQFHARAMEVSQLLDAGIVLRNTDGRQVVNSSVPWGQPLPYTGGELATRLKVVATQLPSTSDLLNGAVTHRLLVDVTVPVRRDGTVAWLLSASLPPERFRQLLDAQELPPDWTISIVDRTNHLLARSGPEGQERVGELISAELRSDISQICSDLGGSLIRLCPVWVSGPDEHRPVFGAYARADVAEFQIIVTAPITSEAALLQKTTRLLEIFGVIAAVFSILLGLGMGSLIARPLRRLAEAGEAIGRGDVMPRLRSPVREIRRLADSLRDASENLRQQALERDLVEEQLRELAATLENRVDQRTHELSDTNAALIQEMASREAAEEQLRQLQKMEAIGQLTGGIAHDFNNMLAVVISGLTLVQRRLAKGQTNVESYVNSALEGANRAATLTKRLLAFSRQQPLAPEPVDANRLVTGMSELLHRTLGETIRIETVLASGLWRTHADPSQLENAILNLAVNARDAMPEGGRLTIETANCNFDESYASQHPGVPAGQYALIAVTDTGIGMPPDVVEKAFDPFFTTKEVGKGTGLGLSQVYGFVRQSGGHIKIYSEANQGTTVKIYLPRFYGAATAAPKAAPAGAFPVGRASELILVVEDEDRVREVSVEALHELGYSTVSARNAVEALRHLDANPNVVLLFTDIVMPDMNGRKLAEEALRRRPDLKVLFTTGFTRDTVVHNGVLDAGLNFIAKPFSIDDLATKIRAVLDS